MYPHHKPRLQVAKLYLMDSSGSMQGPKLDQLKQVLNDIVASGTFYQQDQIALWSFDSLCRQHLGFTPVRLLGPQWRQAVGTLAASGTTNMATALYQAIGAMNTVPQPYKRTIALLSDGMPYPEPREQVLARIPAAQKYHVRINTIGFGEAKAIDLPLLQQLAQATGGSFVHARALQELTAALRAA